ADSQDNRKGHYGEDNNIYLNDANLNNTKDLATTLGHETSHAIDNQDPSINTNPQNNTSKADNEIYAQNYGDDFSDYVEFASENYGDGNLADTNNNNLGNTPAERQRNQKLVDNNNQGYAKIDKSKGEDFCSGTNCYGKATQKRLKESTTNPNVVVIITNKKNTNSNYSNYQVREMQDKNGKVIAYSAYNPNTGNNILMKPEELSTFKASVENNLGYNIENTPNYQHTISNAAAGLHDDGKTGGILNSWGQYAKSDDIIFDVAGGLGGSIALRTSSKVVGKVVGKIKKYTPINPGPLDKRIADTFRSSSYTEKITPKEIVLYRVISKNGNPTGNYLTRAKPRGPLASVIDSSLDQNWGNTATKIVKLKIPKGIKLYEGVAAPQKGLVGGGNQIYLPKIDKNWVIK
ncbi:hypothetical protein, partial [bacterium endosymbiont of Bathymodiolus sp. 5 South]|uniref:hypothetical protein n=1 Tax=bacterium endosymbiont of Bathymodiolus sp. 5 South TaxID=1181670 RepID=UPI0015D5A2A5